MRILSAVAFTATLALSTTLIGLLGAPSWLMGQRAVDSVIRFWARFNILALKFFTGIGYRVEGVENLPQGGAIVASNHQSMWETMMLFLLLPRPTMVLKTDLLRVPIFGWWARPSGSIPVDRSGGAKALRAMCKKAAAKIAAGRQVIIFPEGTRVQPGARQAFQPGVAGIYAAAHAPCTPAAHDSGRFWRHPGIWKKPGVITLKILPAIPAGLDRRKFLDLLEDRIAAARPDLQTEFAHD